MYRVFTETRHRDTINVATLKFEKVIGAYRGRLFFCFCLGFGEKGFEVFWERATSFH